MAHKQQIEFCMKIKGLFPQFFYRKRVLDIGSMDVNGSNRYLFWLCKYIGVDIAMGKNVNFACHAHRIHLSADWFDTIISTEVAEHDKHWHLTMQNTIRMLKPGGLLLFTCATTGRPEHGTKRTDAFSSPFTTDYYKNVTEELVAIKKGPAVNFKPSLVQRILVQFVQFYYLRINDIKDFIKRKILR
jgi:SAM-dependent methyltransferase